MDEQTAKQPFGKREWILLIVVLALVQLIVHAMSWRYASNANALGYISFGGMMVSIILAVIAIIYGFVQTGEQSRASSTIASQVTSLHQILETFKKSGDVLSEQLEQLGDISAGIGKAVALSEKSQEQIIKVQSSVDEMRDLVAGGASRLSKGEAQEKKNESIPTKASRLHETEAIDEYLRKAIVVPAVVMFAIVVANKKGERNFKTIQHKFFTDIYGQVVHPDKGASKGITYFLEGYFAGVVRALSQYFSGTADEITVVDEFANALRKVVTKAKVEGNFGKILDRLRELDREEVPPTTPPATPSSPVSPSG